MISSSTISNNRSSGPRAGWLRWITTGLHETKRILPRVPIKLLYSFEKRITNDVCFYCLVSFFTILFILTLLSLSLYLSAAVILIPFLYFPLVLPLCFFYDSIYSSFCSFISICIRVWGTTRLAHTTTENSVEKGNNSRTNGISIIYIS